MKQNPLIDTAEVARIPNTSQRTVLRWAAEGRLPCVRCGTLLLRYVRSDIEDFAATMPARWVSPKRVASMASRLLRDTVTTTRIYSAIKNGRLPAVRAAGRWMLDPTDAEAFVAAGAHAGGRLRREIVHA